MPFSKAFPANGILLLFLYACSPFYGESSYAEFLYEVHSGVYNCLDSACHPAFFTGGNLFKDGDGLEFAEGVEVYIMNGEEEIAIGRSESLGLFYSIKEDDEEYEGLISVGEYRACKSHKLPEWGGCNICHIAGENEFGTAGTIYIFDNSKFSKDDATISFHDDLKPLFEEKCTMCHSSRNASGNVVLTSYDSVIGKGEGCITILPGKRERSPLYRAIEGSHHGVRLSSDEKEMIGRWIDEGAFEN